MPQQMKADHVIELIRERMMPAFIAEKQRLDLIDKWYRFDHDPPHQPVAATREYKELRDRSQTPWLGLVVTQVAQALYVDGYRSTDDTANAASWSYWQANGLDARQIAIHRAALAYGLSYMTVLPGENPITNAKMPVMRGVSPRRMITFYENPAEDDWPLFGLRCEPATVKKASGFSIRFYDDNDVHYLESDGSGGSLTYIEPREHHIGVCPIVRFANQLDLEGRADGEVEPFIPIAARIDQTTFDRLIVQRFASWVVRTISGMSAPEELTDNDAAAWRANRKLQLRIEDILVSDDPETKFGSLPATSLDGFIAAAEADVKALAAVSQSTLHEMLGQMANLSAEALAAAKASLSAKVDERKHGFGESHEQGLRLGSWIMGDEAGANDTSSQVRWKDTEIRSLAQAADALGKLAQMLHVPVELLWEKIPGFTQQDIDTAKTLLEKPDGLEAMLRAIAAGETSPPDPELT